MGWFTRNRRPFSTQFLERLDRLEEQVEALSPRLATDGPGIEVIPVELTGSRIEDADGRASYSWREITRAAGNDGGRSSDGYDAEGVADEYAFAARPLAAGEAVVVRHLTAAVVGGDAIHEVRHSLLGVGDASFWAEITGSNAVPGAARWTYEWEEVEMGAGSFAPKVGGRDDAEFGQARNSLEDANTSITAYGISVVQVGNGDYSIHDTEDQFKFLPVPDGAVVRMRIESHGGNSYPVFAAPNPIDGIVECPPEAEP